MLLMLGVFWVVVIPAGVIAIASRLAVIRERRDRVAPVSVGCNQPRRTIRAKDLRRCARKAGWGPCGLTGPSSPAGIRVPARSHARGPAWPRRHH